MVEFFQEVHFPNTDNELQLGRLLVASRPVQDIMGLVVKDVKPPHSRKKKFREAHRPKPTASSTPAVAVSPEPEQAPAPATIPIPIPAALPATSNSISVEPFQSSQPAIRIFKEENPLPEMRPDSAEVMIVDSGEVGNGVRKGPVQKNSVQTESPDEPGKKGRAQLKFGAMIACSCACVGAAFSDFDRSPSAGDATDGGGGGGEDRHALTTGQSVPVRSGPLPRLSAAPTAHGR